MSLRRFSSLSVSLAAPVLHVLASSTDEIRWNYSDYYPTDLSSLDFVGVMKPFHDKYTSSSTQFAIGETGLGLAASVADRLAWLKSMTASETKTAMPHLVAVSWFNYMKGYDFRVVGSGVDQSTVVQYLA